MCTPSDSAFEEIPPCTPVQGAIVDPCEANVGVHVTSEGLIDGSDGPVSIRKWLGSRVGAGHLVIRGTYLPDTIRCMADGTTVRLQSWRNENSKHIFRSSAVALCYADVRVNAYIVGSGPSVLTVLVDRKLYGGRRHEELGEQYRSDLERALVEGGSNGSIDAPRDGIGGREYMLFLGTASDVSIEAWWVTSTWAVESQADGAIVAVHPHRDLWRSAGQEGFSMYRPSLEMALPAFTQAVQSAHQARVTEYEGRIGAEDDLPMLVTDANQLREYYTAVGAYSHPDGPPAQPPPPP